VRRPTFRSLVGFKALLRSSDVCHCGASRDSAPPRVGTCGFSPSTYNHGVPIFMCRWPNGDLSFVSARNQEDAIIMLDEWDNAELAELRQIQDFMVDFRLMEDGQLELQAFGEQAWDVIWEKAYPVLSEARQNAPTNSAGEVTPSGEDMIRKAVETEKQ